MTLPTTTAPGRRWGRIAAAMVCAAMFTIALSVASPSSAQADWLSDRMNQAQCDVSPWAAYNEPNTSSSSQFTMTSGASGQPDSKLWNADTATTTGQYTMLEVFGMAGSQWSYTSWAKQSGFGDGQVTEERVCILSNPVINWAANSMLDMSKTITSVGLAVRDLAANPTLILDLLDTMAAPVESVRGVLYAAGAVLMVMLTGLWMMATGVAGDHRKAITGVVWMLVAILAGTVLMNPTSTQDSQGRQVTRPVYYALTMQSLGAIKQVNSELGNLILPKEGSLMCRLNDDAPDRGRRLADCAVYEALVLTPWAQGQFGQTVSDWKVRSGDLPHDADLRLLQIRAQAYSAGELSALQDTNTTAGVRKLGTADQTNTDAATIVGQWNLIRKYIYEHPDQGFSYTLWSGNSPGDRVGVASGSSVAALLAAAFILYTSFLALLWGAALVVLFVALPLMALAGIFPPLQKLLRGWAQTWLKALILLMVFQIVQSFALLVITSILATPASVGIQALMMAVVLVGMVKVLKMLREDAVTPNLGGEESAQMFDADAGLNKAKDRSRRVAGMAGKAIGAAVVSGGAGAIAGGFTAATRNAANRKERRAQIKERVTERVDAERERRAQIREQVTESLDTDQTQTGDESTGQPTGETRGSRRYGPVVAAWREDRKVTKQARKEAEKEEKKAVPKAARVSVIGGVVGGGTSGMVYGASHRYSNPLVGGLSAGAQRSHRVADMKDERREAARAADEQRRADARFTDDSADSLPAELRDTALKRDMRDAERELLRARQEGADEAEMRRLEKNWRDARLRLAGAGRR